MAARADIKAGRAYVELLLKDGAFTKGLKAASQKLKDWGSGIRAEGAAIAAAGAAIKAPMIALAHSFAESGTELLRMSQRTGMSVEALSELRFAAQESGL